MVADGGNSTTQFKTDLTLTLDDVLKDSFARFILLNGVAQVGLKKVSSLNGTTKIVVCLALPVTPIADDLVYFITY